MISQAPRAVIFDWDNTLVDNWGAITESMNAARAAFGQGPWTVAEAKVLCNRALRDSFPEWFGATWERARDIFYDCFNQTHLNHLQALAGAQDLLVFLRERDIPLFVVTNKRGDLMRREAARLGWTEHFVAMVGSLDAPRDKPERDPVDLALGRGNLKADDPAVWFVGDTSVDVVCARNSGCTPVLVNNAAESARLGLELAFSDCQALRGLLYSRFGPSA